MSGGPTHSAHLTEAVHDYLPTNESHAQEPTKFQAEQALAQTFESGGLPQSLNTYNGRGGQQRSHGHALSQSEALIAKNLHLNAIKTLTDQFGGRLVDVAENSVIVELTAKSSRVEAFLSLLRPFGILEAARSGKPAPKSVTRDLFPETLTRITFVVVGLQDRWSCPEPPSLVTTTTTTSPPKSPRSTPRCFLPVKPLRPGRSTKARYPKKLGKACAFQAGAVVVSPRVAMFTL